MNESRTARHSDRRYQNNNDLVRKGNRGWKKQDVLFVIIINIAKEAADYAGMIDGQIRR
jgi:hypothetical protein